jgi:opacity protein-like surface antigen
MIYRINLPKLILVGSILLLYCSTSPINAQIRFDSEPETKIDWKDRVFYGGGLGLQFGNVTLVDISPLVGYKLTSRIGLGINLTYKYYSYRNYYGSNADLKSNIVGGGLFARVLIIEKLFAHAEYEYLLFNTKETYYSTQEYKNEYHSVLVGAGYREPVAENAFMYLLVLWNINETIDSPYNNPVIRAGFSVGF